MFNKFFKLIIFNFIILLLLISKSLSKPLPPGSGAGDVPANILILLDKSGSMSARQVFGTPTVYPYKIAVGNTTKDGGKNVLHNSYYSWYDKRNVAYDDKLTWKYNSRTPCTYRSQTRVAEYYNGNFWFVNAQGQLCKLNETTGKITYSKNFGSSSGWWGGELHGQYLYVFGKGRIRIFDLAASDPGSSSSSKLCTYGNTNNKAKLGYYLSNPYVTRNGAGEINRGGSYMVFYRYDDWARRTQRGFYKFNLTPGLNCVDENYDQFAAYDTGWSGQFRAIESSSLDDDHFYIANYSFSRIERFDLSDTTISSSDRVAIGKYGQVTQGYNPASRSNYLFRNPMELAVDASNNRLYVSDTWNSMIQIFSEESDGIDWIKKVGSTFGKSRMQGAHEAIKAITTDPTLTGGVHFGFSYWSYSGGIWVYNSWVTKYPSCLSIKTKLLNKYSWLTSGSWIFNTSRKYRCRDMGSDFGYKGWNDKKNQGIPCDNYGCLKVKVNKDGAKRTAKVVTQTTPGGGTDAKMFTKIALEYFDHKTDSPMKDKLDCQVNYIIVIGDGIWMNHKQGLKDIKTLKGKGVKTITIAYGGGISSSGIKNFAEYAKEGGTEDVIVANDPASLKQALTSEINRIIAEKVSFTAPAITATVEEGGALMQAQFKYRQGKEWKGTLKKTSLDDNGMPTKVEWEADKKMPDPKNRKIWSPILGTDYTTDLNNFVSSNVDHIKRLYSLFGTSLQDYHSQTPTVAGTIGTSRCKSVSTVEDGTDDDAKGLINFVRGEDYFDYNGNCNLTETRTDGGLSILGDIYHSEMIIVGGPDADTDFNSSNEEAYYRNIKGYNNWKSSRNMSDRQRLIYVGANDSMLHAFDYKTGIEKWAFVPPFLIPKLPLMINKNLNLAAPKGGGSNAVFGVDGSPVQRDVYIKNPHDGISAAPRWHTILVVPYGRGGNGFSVLDVTDVDQPRHFYSVYNDRINHKVFIMNHAGIYREYPYMPSSYSFMNTMEAQEVQALYDDDSTIDAECNSTKTTSCYKSKTFTIENFPAKTISTNDLSVTVNGSKDTGASFRLSSNFLIITFSQEVQYQANGNFDPSDQVSIDVNLKSDLLGVKDPRHYDYSELGETWSAPRIIRMPNKGKGDQDVEDDKYVIVMGGGYGAKFGGVGSGVYVINLGDGDPLTPEYDIPGKIEKYIKIDDDSNNDIANSVPGDPVVITTDSVKGFVNYRGALVYVSDLEGKISKINLTNLDEGVDTELYDHYTMFNTKTTANQGRYMFHSMDAGIGKTTKKLWLFAGTGDIENITDPTPLGGNLLLGIEDKSFPGFGKPSLALGTPNVEKSLKDCSDTTKDTNGSMCPQNVKDKIGWMIELAKDKKVTAPPTVSSGVVYFPIYTPEKNDKCKSGKATICAVDDECGTNISSLLGKDANDDDCHFVGMGILSKIVTYGGKIYANIAGKTSDGKDLITKDAIAVEVDIMRGTWKQN